MKNRNAVPSQMRPVGGLCFGVLFISLAAVAQPASAPSAAALTKLPLTADLVLPSEFCATKRRESTGLFALRVGEAACSQFEAGLREVFSNVIRLEDVPAVGAGAAQLVLIPRFVDVSVTEPLFSFSQRELVVLVEWTIKDRGGRVIWLQTIRGSSRQKEGLMITKGRQRQLVNAAIADVTQSSAEQISAAPELRKLVP